MGRSMLLLVSGFVVIFGIIQQSAQNRQQVMQQRAPEYYYQEQSRYIAGAMMEIALGNLNHDDHYLEPQKHLEKEVDNMFGDEFGKSKGTITVDSTTNFQSRVHTTITGIFEKPDGTTIRTEIKAKFKRDAFSIYAYFTDYEPVIWFGTGDVLNGPIHTNGKFHIRGKPVFNGPISSHGGIRTTGSANPTYNGGKNFDANEIKLPTEAPEVVNLAQSKNGGIGQFNNDIFVEFKDTDPNNNTGTVEISSATVQCVEQNRYGNCERRDYAPNPRTTRTFNLADFNGVISSNKKVYVKGKVDGQATVHSKKEVEVMGDLVYENRNYDDQSQTISDDRLGLISEGDTIVDNDAHKDDSYGSNTGKDLYIDASILSLGESFRVQGYGDYERKGTLNILGGLIQEERGPVGKVDGRGYSKNYQYDTRFLTGSTPGFPRKKKFDVETWRESTRTIKQQDNNQQNDDDEED